MRHISIHEGDHEEERCPAVRLPVNDNQLCTDLVIQRELAADDF